MKKEKKPETKSGSVIILNPPEKLPPRNVNEIVTAFFKRRDEVLQERSLLALRHKAEKHDISEDVLIEVYSRGLNSYTSSLKLTKEQFAMNRVNSFIAGGISLIEDNDLIPIHEAPQTTGGAARPHIMAVRNPYSGTTSYHVMDNKGNVVHTVPSEMEARNHLAKNYRKYLKNEFVLESVRGTIKARRPGTGGAARPRVIKQADPYNPNKIVYIVVGKKHDEKSGRKDVKLTTQDAKMAYDHLRKNYNKYLSEDVSKNDPKSRFEGTKSLVKIYKKDTPGEDVKEEKMKGDDPCWKGYEMVGHKEKGNRKVPNCVPVGKKGSK